MEVKKKVPHHLAIIMDGNHRWARQNGLTGGIGHRRGANNVRPVIEACADEGVSVLTLFAFSTENWNRPKREIDLIFQLISETLKRDLDALHDRDARLFFVGKRNRLPKDLLNQIYHCESRTEHNQNLRLFIALDYGGRWELLNAASKIAQEAIHTGIRPNELDEEQFRSYLSMDGIPDPDLCIRTGGDQRLSNFLLWNLAYTELHFTETYWPDFSKNDLEIAFLDYSQRHRRFGTRSQDTAIRATL